MFIQQERAYITDDDALRKEAEELIDKLAEMHLYFERQAKIIIAKCVDGVIKEIRSLSRTGEGIKFLGDDFDEMTFFDQLCAISRYGNTECYFPAMMYIEECCSAEIDKLTEDECFTLENTSNDFYNPFFSLKKSVIRYLTDYSNKRIEKHVHYFV